MILNMHQAISILKTGDVIQPATAASSFPQLTIAKPRAMMPKPIMAPTIEWVVETGSDFQVAKLTHRAEASRAASAPIRSRCGSPRRSVETVPLRIVLVTWAPIKVAPRQLRMPATKMARRMVRALAPTAEALELGDIVGLNVPRHVTADHISGYQNRHRRLAPFQVLRFGLPSHHSCGWNSPMQRWKPRERARPEAMPT